MSYSVACKSCGNVLSTAWEKVRSPASPDGEYLPSATPLTAKGHIPVLCPRCGARDWQSPALPEQVTKFEAAQQREARASALCRSLDLNGLLKIPEDVRASAEIKNALSNLLAPLEGETLKQAQAMVQRVAKSGVAISAELWIELYDKAVAKAIIDAKEAAKETKAAKESKVTV